MFSSKIRICKIQRHHCTNLALEVIQWKFILSNEMIKNWPNKDKNESKQENKTGNNIIEDLIPLNNEPISISHIYIPGEDQATMDNGHNRPIQYPKSDVILTRKHHLVLRHLKIHLIM